MPQPKIRNDQFKQAPKVADSNVKNIFGVPLNIENLARGDSLVFDGNSWKNASNATNSSNVKVAQLDASLNTFSAKGVALNLNDTSQKSDEKIWQLGYKSGQFTIATRTDNDSPGNPALTLIRTGTTVDSINSNALFVSPIIKIRSQTPTLIFVNNTAVADEKVWEIITDKSGTLQIQTKTDANGRGATVLEITRSSIVGTNIKLSATVLTGTRAVFTTATGAHDAGGTINLINNNPGVAWQDIDADPNEGNWTAFISDGNFLLRAYDDKYKSFNTPLKITRTGTRTDSISLVASSVTINGSEVLTKADLDLNNNVIVTPQRNDVSPGTIRYRKQTGPITLSGMTDLINVKSLSGQNLEVGDWKVELFLIISCDDPEVNFKWQLTSNSGQCESGFGESTTSFANQPHIINNESIDSYTTRIQGILPVTAEGTFDIQWAQDTSSATPIQLHGGSSVIYTKLT